MKIRKKLYLVNSYRYIQFHDRTLFGFIIIQWTKTDTTTSVDENKTKNHALSVYYSHVVYVKGNLSVSTDKDLKH